MCGEGVYPVHTAPDDNTKPAPSYGTDVALYGTVMRRLITGVLLILLGFSLGAFADAGWSMTAPLGATEQEADEGYFALGHDTMVVVKQGSQLHVWLRGHLGQRLKLTLAPDTESH